MRRSGNFGQSLDSAMVARFMLQCHSPHLEKAVIEFNIDAMTCGHCVRTVTQVVQQVDPDAQVTVDLPAHRVQVQTGKTREAIAAALVEAGYPPK